MRRLAFLIVVAVLAVVLLGQSIPAQASYASTDFRWFSSSTKINDAVTWTTFPTTLVSQDDAITSQFKNIDIATIESNAVTLMNHVPMDSWAAAMDEQKAMTTAGYSNVCFVDEVDVNFVPQAEVVAYVAKMPMQDNSAPLLGGTISKANPDVTQQGEWRNATQRYAGDAPYTAMLICFRVPGIIDII